MAAGKSKKSKPSFEVELQEIGDEDGIVCGVDEAGRGPLAGPVVAAAAAISVGGNRELLLQQLNKLNDSKTLSEDVRNELYEQVTRTFECCVGIADVERIDRDNILQATLWAMREAVGSLKSAPGVVLVDGNRDPGFGARTRMVVGGDAKCLSIAAASVVAKVTRDRMMIEMDKTHPAYGFAQNKGYGTKAHLEALRLHGPTPHHRRSFRPVRVAMGLED